MSKYIRTKDGIFDEERYELCKAFVGVLQDESAKIMPMEKTDFSIISKADTIEELCDEFVVFDKEQPNGKLLYINGFENLKKEFIDFERDKGKVVVYGAIWTDKGLIYVAKMNDKGTLELL